MTASARVSGLWKDAAPSARVGGIWKPADLWVKAGGVWQRLQVDGYGGSITIGEYPGAVLGYSPSLGIGSITSFPELDPQPFLAIAWDPGNLSVLIVLTTCIGGILRISGTDCDLAECEEFDATTYQGAFTVASPLPATPGGTLPFILIDPVFPATGPDVHDGTLTVGDLSPLGSPYLGYYDEFDVGELVFDPPLAELGFKVLIWYPLAPTVLNVSTRLTSGTLTIAGTNCDLSTCEDSGDGNYTGAFSLSSPLPTTAGGNVACTLTDPEFP